MVVQFNSAKQANTAKKDIKRKKIKIKKKKHLRIIYTDKPKLWMECTYILDEIFPTSKRSLPREILQTSSKSKRHLNHIIFRFCLWHQIFTTFHLSHLTQGFLFFVLATNLPHSPTDVTQKSGLYEETKKWDSVLFYTGLSEK